MKTNNHKITMMELAELCGVHVDTLYKSKRRKYCTRRMAKLLAQVTAIPMKAWLDPASAKTDPWERVLK
jgi:hypothetical protein